jgi:hypothetical protein
MVPVPDESRSEDVEEHTKPERRKRGPDGSKGEPDVTAHPTPIRISRRTRTALILATIAALAYVVYRVPDVLAMTVGGIALALILSFPVGFLSRLMPRGLAILLSFLLVVGLVVLAALFLVPLVVEQFVALIGAVPGIASTIEQYLQDALNLLQNRGLLPTNPDQLTSRTAAWLMGLVSLDEAFVFLWTLLRWPTALFLLALVVAAVYRYAPDADLPFRSVLPGAVVAVISWALASLAFSFFLGVFPVHGVAYGGLGTAISLLLYLYFSAAVLLFGAELNAELRRDATKGGGGEGGAPCPTGPKNGGAPLPPAP